MGLGVCGCGSMGVEMCVYLSLRRAWVTRSQEWYWSKAVFLARASTVSMNLTKQRVQQRDHKEGCIAWKEQPELFIL